MEIHCKIKNGSSGGARCWQPGQVNIIAVPNRNYEFSKITVVY